MYIPIDALILFQTPPSRYSCRTTKGCHLLLVISLGMPIWSQWSSGFAGGFLRLRWSSCVPVPKVSKNWRFCAGYGLLQHTCDYQLVIGLCKFTQNFNNDCSKKRNSDRSFSTTRPNSLKRYLDFVLSITSY